MSAPSARRRWRYLVPVALAGAIGVGAWLPTLPASASPTLPPQSADQLVARAEQPSVDSFTGIIEWTANLGLPDISGLVGSTGSPGRGLSVTDLLSGSHQVKVWDGGANGQRLALIGSASEVDLYSSSDATGNQTWLYDSASNTATHLVTAGVAGGPSPAGPARAPNPADAAGPALTPAQVARQVLAGVEGVTTLSVGPATYIAGQPAYVLTLAPKPGAAGAADSTVGRISIGIDATDGPGSGAVLQVSVTPAGGSVPALSVGFQSVHFMADGRSLPAAGFGFAPPPGTKEVTQTVGEGASGAAGLPAAGAPRVVGSAWGTVVVFHGAGPLLAGDASSAGSRVVAHRAGAVVVKPHLLGHRSVLSPGTPSPGTPSPGIPSPGIPSPGTPSPGTPSPGILGPLDALTTPVQGPSGTARLLSTSLVNILVLPDGDVAAGFVTPRALVAAVGAAG